MMRDRRPCPLWVTHLENGVIRPASLPRSPRQRRRDQAATLPAPIDSVMADQSARDLHDLDEIHLVAVGGRARVLPDEQAPAVGQPLAGTVPAHEVVRPALRALAEEV